MRFNEFNKLSEAAINPTTFAPSERNRGRNSNYWRNLIDLIAQGRPIYLDGSTTPVTFDKSVADTLSGIWDPVGSKDEEATPEQVLQMKALQLPTTDGRVVKINQIEKNKDIKQLVGSEPGEAPKTKWWNKGNVAEGIMACAVIAKFSTGGEDVTFEKVLETVQSVEAQIIPADPTSKNPRERVRGVLSTECFGKPLSLTITLSGNDFRALLMSAKSKAEFEEFEQSEEIYKLYEDCAFYVNDSDNVVGAIEKIKTAAAEDSVTVTADGATAEAQSSTKADLWIAVGERKERLLSIKTSTVKHIGAVSGYEFDHINEFFRSTVGLQLSEELHSTFLKPPAAKFITQTDAEGNEEKIPNPEYQKMTVDQRRAAIRKAMNTNFDKAIKKSYRYIMEQLQERLSGKSDDVQYNFVETVTKGVVHHATLGDEIRLVVISPSAKKAYTELEFGPELYEAVSQYDLVPKLDVGANYRILIYGYPVGDKAKRIQNDKTLFVQLRSYIQDGAARNVVEMGGLLKQLTDITKKIEKEQGEFTTVNKAGTASTAQVHKQQPAQPAPEPQASGIPSGMTAIAPASDVLPQADANEVPTEPDEIDRIRRNAGITVE